MTADTSSSIESVHLQISSLNHSLQQLARAKLFGGFTLTLLGWLGLVGAFFYPKLGLASIIMFLLVALIVNRRIARMEKRLQEETDTLSNAVSVEFRQKIQSLRGAASELHSLRKSKLRWQYAIGFCFLCTLTFAFGFSSWTLFGSLSALTVFCCWRLFGVANSVRAAYADFQRQKERAGAFEDFPDSPGLWWFWREF